MNKYIAGALVFLILLIVATLIFTSFLNKSSTISQQNQPTPIPTVSANSSNATKNIPTFSSQKAQEEVNAINKSLTQDQINTMSKFQKRLPYFSEDFNIGYSDLLGTYFIQKKTPIADQKIQEFFDQNNLSDIQKEFPSFFEVSTNNVNDQIIKREISVIKLREEKIQNYAPLPSPVNTVQQKDIKLLTDMTIAILNIGKKAGGTGDIANPTELDKIFNEAGSKVGTPPKYLKAMMAIECGRLISSTPVQDILAWSAPGAPGLPPNHFCYRNSIGAMGPMQFMGNTWPTYATAVNRNGGYTHSPSVENIRDSVYGAAEKFKSDAQADGPNWTEAQIRRAYGCYASGCGGYARNPEASQGLYNRFVQLYNSM